MIFVPNDRTKIAHGRMWDKKSAKIDLWDRTKNFVMSINVCAKHGTNKNFHVLACLAPYTKHNQRALVLAMKKNYIKCFQKF